MTEQIKQLVRREVIPRREQVRVRNVRQENTVLPEQHHVRIVQREPTQRQVHQVA